MSCNFFQNKDCEYFPCHKVTKEQEGDFNCIFCFCPLYPRKDCGGGYTITEHGKKDCTSCILPHYNYDYIIKKLNDDK